MNRRIEKLDTSSHTVFMEMIGETGTRPYACPASVDPPGPEKNDSIRRVRDVMTVGESCAPGAGGEITFV